MLAIFYEKWTGRKVKRLNKNKQYRTNKKFYDFISYLIESLELSRIWGPGSIHKAIQRVIEKYLLPIRGYLNKNYPSISLHDIEKGRVPFDRALLENLIRMSENPVENISKSLKVLNRI
jgi:hypothetical protein